MEAGKEVKDYFQRCFAQRFSLFVFFFVGAALRLRAGSNHTAAALRDCQPVSRGAAGLSSEQAPRPAGSRLNSRPVRRITGQFIYLFRHTTTPTFIQQYLPSFSLEANGWFPHMWFTQDRINLSALTLPLELHIVAALCCIKHSKSMHARLVHHRQHNHCN